MNTGEDRNKDRSKNWITLQWLKASSKKLFGRLRFERLFRKISQVCVSTSWINSNTFHEFWKETPFVSTWLIKDIILKIQENFIRPRLLLGFSTPQTYISSVIRQTRKKTWTWLTLTSLPCVPRWFIQTVAHEMLFRFQAPQKIP